jgi:class 3 adenylate cyclase
MGIADAVLLAVVCGLALCHLAQRRKARLVARFVAPQVADLVRERGLRYASKSRTREISAVYCDLRGYTIACESSPSRTIVKMLSEYYAAVGAAAEAHGGTVKDHAGDGVLILVGAPRRVEDHARRALKIARRIRASGLELAERWASTGTSLGVGIGVATGTVVVGVIGAASRLEYTAVGPAINLAARLCARSGHGEILMDARSSELLEAETQQGAVRPAERRLKGAGRAVQVYEFADERSAP